MLAEIRRFFYERQVLEVETPLLCSTTGTDPQLDFFSTLYHSPPRNLTVFLQTSPEFAMKRLLAAGSGSIYQICKAFRNSECGRLHNPEFTILEWYRLGFNLYELMEEVGILLQQLFGSSLQVPSIKQISYQQLFRQVTGLDALNFNLADYQGYARQSGYEEALALCVEDPVLWLDFLFSHCVQPQMEQQQIYLVYGYPAILSSLARINLQDSRVSERFEVFINGIELGNGFFELADADEQAQRFDLEIQLRQQRGLPLVDKDLRLLAALRSGLPDCSGVAIGLDRLLLLLSNSRSLDEVLAFPFAHA